MYMLILTVSLIAVLMRLCDVDATILILAFG
jgi:hypothetical protein